MDRKSAAASKEANETEEKVEAAALHIGMFVSSLDRPWLGTPFLLQGFLIESEEELAQLRQLCQYVFIDRRRSIGEHFSERPRAPLARASASVQARTVAYTTGSADSEQSNFLAFIRKLRKRRPADPEDAENAATMRRSLTQ